MSDKSKRQFKVLGSQLEGFETYSISTVDKKSAADFLISVFSYRIITDQYKLASRHQNEEDSKESRIANAISDLPSNAIISNMVIKDDEKMSNALENAIAFIVSYNPSVFTPIFPDSTLGLNKLSEATQKKAVLNAASLLLRDQIDYKISASNMDLVFSEFI